MFRFLSKFLVLIFFLIFILIAYLSYFGLETNRFDDLIKNKANKVNQNIKLEFSKVKIHINPKKINLSVKLKNAKIIANEEEINLSKLNLFLSLESFFNSKFLLKRVEIAFKQNDIKDLTKLTGIFFHKIINKKIKKTLIQGKLEGELIIPFNEDGNIGENYSFSGKILNASIKLNDKLHLKNLTTEIKHSKYKKENIFDIKVKKGTIFDLDFDESTIKITREDKETKIKSFVRTNGKFNFDQVKKLSFLFNKKFENLNNLEGQGDLKATIDFLLNKSNKIKNLTYSMDGNFSSLNIKFKEKKFIYEYLPEYKDLLSFKDTEFNLIKTPSDRTANLNGFIKINRDYDKIQAKQVFNYDKNSFNLKGVIDTTNTIFKIKKINFIKQNKKKSEILFNFDFSPNKYYKVNNLSFLDQKNKIYLSNLELNKDFEINNFEKIEVKTYKSGAKNNDFLVKKFDKIIVSGEIFDAEDLLKSLYKNDSKKIFSKNFNSEVKINFNKALTGTNDDVVDFVMIATISKGSYDKLSLKGNFSDTEIIEMSIYQIDNNKKTLQIISDRARPFVKNFDFIEGFEEGKLEYESIISKESSSSNLKIEEFKVSKVPALAKLLTLASLQGIADTLSGEGIRFKSFEMKSNSKGNVMNIEDALAFGPAVSILLEGYVDKGKTVSLRGTLVPATKLNSIIASIPVVGNILVGKKSGEGVVGVSFKMKGPPKNIKTSVNPIKTITPRFILRAIENMKKKKE